MRCDKKGLGVKKENKEKEPKQIQFKRKKLLVMWIREDSFV